MPQTNRDTVEEFWQASDIETACNTASESSITGFKAALQDFLGTQNPIFLCNRATTGLTRLLKKSRNGEKNTVLLSSLNCPTVIDAVNNAGCTADYFDHSNEKGAIDWHAVESRLTPNHCAIIIPHLYGVPSDFSAIIAKARTKDILLIEDCAHTFGARIGKDIAGTLGDAAIFSFNYDKPMSLGGGGAVLVNNPALLPFDGENQVCDSDELDNLSTISAWLKQRRWLIDKEQGWKNIYSRLLFKTGIQHPIAYRQPMAFGMIRAQLGLAMLEKYENIRKKRNDNAAILQDHLRVHWNTPTNSTPAWLRYKWTAPDNETAQAIARNLRQQGLRAGLYNWPKIHYDKGGENNFPNAQAIATRALDLPIHQNMTDAALEQIIKEIQKHSP